MSNQPASLKGIRLQLLQTDGSPLLGKEYRNFLIAIANSFSNMSVVATRQDGTSESADVKLTEMGCVITLPKDLGGSSGGSLELTDGTTDLTGVTKITVSGAIVGGTSAAATLTIADGGIKGFQLVSDGGDYYNCHTFDGVTVGSSIIRVAKTQDLRCGVGAWGTHAIRGVTYTYTYNALGGGTTVEYSRGVSGSDGTSETDFVTPGLVVGDTIYAIPATFAGPSSLVSVLWLALADGRAWSK